MSDREPPAILVAGDVTVDWAMLAPDAAVPGLHDSYRWERPAPVQISPAPGSAALLYGLVRAGAGALPGERQPRVTGPSLPAGALLNPADQGVTRSYALWQEYPVRSGSREPAWRLSQFLGLQPETSDPCQPPASDGALACLVIDDANLGFRDRPERWPSALDASANLAPAQIILKMSTPLARGPLWERLAGDFADRLTVYCAVGDLRKEFAPIGQPLSWERTGSDVVEAVLAHPALGQAARVIVSLGLSGAVLVERGGVPTLIYDPQHQEGDWERARPGSTPGLGTAIMAALALASAASPQAPDWPNAIRRGLAAARLVHEHGFTPASEGLSFPLDAARLLAGAEPDAFHEAAIPSEPGWQISTAAFQGDERRAAEKIALEGEEIACRNLPLERMGAWASIDRTEIESMRSVRNIIREYLQQERHTRPLSLAVFGPPGSGKSFAIKQMAKEWIAGGAQIEVLEFNVSQFAAGELPRALQRVRDCAVEQRLPLVFWDEFDTPLQGRELGWLAQFLAPMQDGLFLEEGVSRPIGPAIFIFAGGTHAALASFKDRAVELPGAKATDFLSRLRGFVDILGPNPNGPHDGSFVLRRALLLRALLKQKAPQLVARGRLQIDPGVLRAFLDVTSYVHGARSLEAIVDMSALSGKLRYERSALPPQHQLGLHVDAEEFLALVRGA